MDFATREDEDEYEWEGRRAAMVRLLLMRGHSQAGAIVHTSHYRTDYAGNGTYTVTLSVLPELYDYAREEFSDVLREACVDIVGADRFSELVFRVRPPDEAERSDLERALLDSLSARQVPSERVVVNAITASPT